MGSAVTVRVVMPPGAALWKIVLRQQGDNPVAAMRTLREAGASAKTRAKLAVEAWGSGDPEKLRAALLTLRSCEALRWALEHLGWDENTPDPLASVARLLRLAGIERKDERINEDESTKRITQDSSGDHEPNWMATEPPMPKRPNPFKGRPWSRKR